jgi:hypothetical protein
MLTMHKDSHVDHNLTQEQLDWILQRFADKNEFFIETFTLPLANGLGRVTCGLYGPAMGDAAVPEGDVYYAPRGNRPYPSRLVKGRPPRPTGLVTVIGGPHDGEACVLYTAFGGPVTPQEPGDPACKDVEASKKFWADHALVD